MEAIQIWFEPILWIIGTLTAFAAFIRLCKPIWTFLQYPTTFTKELKIFEAKLDETFKMLQDNEKINKKQEAVQLSLLHDAIIQIYNNAKNEGILHTAEYQRAVNLYKENGQSEYIDALMEEMKSMWKEGQRNETNSGKDS